MLLALSSNQKLAIALVAAAFVGFALLSAVIIPRANPDFPDRRLNLFIGVSVLFTVAMLLTVAFVAKESEEETHAAITETQTTTTETTESTATAENPTGTTETGTTETAAPSGDAEAGKAVFTSTCGGCHTLSDAGTGGSVGPNLDDASPGFDRVVERATHGKGVRPAFGDSGTLTEAQIQDVAAYVSYVSGS